MHALGCVQLPCLPRRSTVTADILLATALREAGGEVSYRCLVPVLSGARSASAGKVINTGGPVQ
jgi:hypothetical protein